MLELRLVMGTAARPQQDPASMSSVVVNHGPAACMMNSSPSEYAQVAAGRPSWGRGVGSTSLASKTCAPASRFATPPGHVVAMHSRSHRPLADSQPWSPG